VSVCAKLHRGACCFIFLLFIIFPLIFIIKLNISKTACGDTWTIATSATEVVLTYPLTSCSDADDIGSE
jgi:hypothetical protein